MTDTQYKDVVPHLPKSGIGEKVGEIIQFVPRAMDSMVNLITGLGGAGDKNTHNRHTFRELDRVELENAYRGDWIARKVVEVPAKDSIREGRNWQTKKDTIEKIELEEARLNFWKVMQEARILGRLYGGGAIIVGGPGHPEEPLDPKMVTRGGLKYLLPVSRYDLRPEGLDVDLMSPWFGQPQYWELQLTSSQVRGRIRYPRLHPSRVIRFFGNDIPRSQLSRSANEFWSDSVLQVVNDAVMHASVAQAGVAGLVQEAKLDVVRIPNLMEHLSSEEYTSRLTQRFMFASAAKSSQNTLILDSEELWERKQINFTQLPDILKLYLQIAAGAADIPATRIVGLSPQGLNATGDTEERIYYDRIKSEQKSDITPTIAPLDEMIKRSAMGKSPRDVFYMWAPLWQMSAKEAADVAKQKADTVAKIAETNLVPMEALGRSQANQLIEDGQFPGFEAAFEEAGEQIGPGPVKKTAETTPTQPGGQTTQPDPTEPVVTGGNQGA